MDGLAEWHLTKTGIVQVVCDSDRAGSALLTLGVKDLDRIIAQLVERAFTVRLHHIPVGSSHRNRKVRLLVAGPDVRIITEDGELIRALTLDPSRSYQPLGGRWPVHNVLQQVSDMS
jgi:hypothetical protein